MCRKVLVAGLIMIALGLGLLLATLLPSGFLIVLISLALIIGGVFIFRSKK